MKNTLSTTIYFIRHGEVENPKQIIYGRRNFPLSNNGRSQIERLAQYLRALAIVPDIIYTSPLKRALESAEKLQEMFAQVSIIQDARLQEIDIEALEGKAIAWNNRIQRDIYTFAKNARITIESPKNIIDRMIGVLEDMLVKHKGETIFAVSHGDPITFLLWRLLYPNNTIPSYIFVAKGNFLREAQVWEMVFDRSRNLLHHVLISTA